VPSEFALEALLHDASEAYCNDIAAPLKALLPDYRGIEKWVEGLISQKFGLPETMSPESNRLISSCWPQNAATCLLMTILNGPFSGHSAYG
jgi:5'-deoxynucleotidase YfbR-like HD superfamily hydrolase